MLCFANLELCFDVTLCCVLDDIVLCFNHTMLCLDDIVLCFNHTMLCFENIVLSFDNTMLCFNNSLVVHR